MASLPLWEALGSCCVPAPHWSGPGDSVVGTCPPALRVRLTRSFNPVCLFFQVKLVNIRNDDITDGNPKLTLGLIWTIILHFQVGHGIFLPEDAGRASGAVESLFFCIFHGDVSTWMGLEVHGSVMETTLGAQQQPPLVICIMKSLMMGCVPGLPGLLAVPVCSAGVSGGEE